MGRRSGPPIFIALQNGWPGLRRHAFENVRGAACRAMTGLGLKVWRSTRQRARRKREIRCDADGSENEVRSEVPVNVLAAIVGQRAVILDGENGMAIDARARHARDAVPVRPRPVITFV